MSLDSQLEHGQIAVEPRSREAEPEVEVGSEIPLSEQRDCLIDHYRFHSAPESGSMKRLSGADGPVTPRDNRLEPVGG